MLRNSLNIDWIYIARHDVLGEHIKWLRLVGIESGHHSFVTLPASI